MNAKKKLLPVLLALVVLTLSLSACGSKPSGEETPPAAQSTPVTPSAPEDALPEDAQEKELTLLAELVGKHDDEVKDLYGGGVENKTEDGSVLLGRSYETTLDGNAATLETVYTEENTVAAVSVFFTDLSAEDVQALLTAAFGEPTATDDTQAMDSKLLTWTRDSAAITMNESYGMASVQFTLA